MSLIASIHTKDESYIVTDTLTSLQTPGIPHFPPFVWDSCSKIEIFPHLKSCIVNIGSCLISQQLNCFINNNFCLGIEDLIDQIEYEFAPYINLDEHPYDKETGNSIAMLTVAGYSEREKQMLVYTIWIQRDKTTVNKIDNNKQHPASLMHPRLDPKIEDKIFAEGITKSRPIEEHLKEIAKQMYLDSLDEDKFSVPIGGELHLTVVGCKPHFFCTTTVVHRLDNFDSLMEEIKSNRKKHFEALKPAILM